MTTLQARNLTKHFGSLVAVEDVSLDVKSGELLALLGPSGCGKSTTLRMLAGLETPTAGEIYLDGEDITNTPPYHRDTAMVFQSWALFPYKTVLENVAFGLKMDGLGKEERREQAMETLEMMHMGEYADSNPKDLSGGQQQRVALARSLALNPKVLLLDEPLSNLDKRLKEEMQLELKNIHQEFEKTIVHVTHDQNEAFTLADRIGIMNDGELIQIGEPREVYSNPKNRFVEEFLGETNFVTAAVNEQDGQQTELVINESFRVPITDENGAFTGQDNVDISIRPEIVSTAAGQPGAEDADGQNSDTVSVVGEVKNILYRGSIIRYYLDVGGTEIFVEDDISKDRRLEVGQTVTVSWNNRELLLFGEGGSKLSVFSDS